MEIRPAEPSDLAEVAEIEAASIPQPWSLKSFSEALRSPNVIFLVAEKSGTEETVETGSSAAEEVPEENGMKKIVGYCVLYTASDEGEIPAIAVEKKYRRRGIARELLRKAAALAEQKNVRRIFLEVRESNRAAKSLYESAGFLTDGKRPRFYAEPVEDAWIMHQDLEDPYQ